MNPCGPLAGARTVRVEQKACHHGMVADLDQGHEAQRPCTPATVQSSCSSPEGATARRRTASSAPCSARAPPDHPLTSHHSWAPLLVLLPYTPALAPWHPTALAITTRDMPTWYSLAAPGHGRGVSV